MEFESNTKSWYPDNDAFKAPSNESQSNKKNRKKIKMAVVYCTKCKSLIKEKHLFRIGEHFWHKSCVLCDNCTGQLDDNAYLVEEKLLCHSCYYKSMHAPKCFGCNRLLLSNDYAMYSLNNPYHLSCFKCYICGNLISKGDRYIVNNGQLICKQDFEANRAAASSVNANRSQSASTVNPTKYSNSNDSLTSTSSAINLTSSGGGSGNQNGVRKKTKITSDQRIYLERYYNKIQNPTVKQREIIAQELDLPPKVVQTWFCNYRTKLKLQKTNGMSMNRDRHYSDDQESTTSSRIKSMLHEPCMTPDQDFPATNCQISQSTEDHTSPQDLSSDMSGNYTCTANEILRHAHPQQLQQHHHHQQQQQLTLLSSHPHKLTAATSHIQHLNSASPISPSSLNAPVSAHHHHHHDHHHHHHQQDDSTSNSNGEFTLTELSNSCAKSIEQTILAGFSAISESGNQTIGVSGGTSTAVD